MKMCFVKGRYLGLCSLLCENMFFPFFVVCFGCEEAFLGHWIRLSILNTTPSSTKTRESSYNVSTNGQPVVCIGWRCSNSKKQNMLYTKIVALDACAWITLNREPKWFVLWSSEVVFYTHGPVFPSRYRSLVGLFIYLFFLLILLLAG